MTRTKWAAAAVVAGVVALALARPAIFAQVTARAAARPASSVEALLGQALHQEEVEGNVRAAIATYEKVLAAPSATKSQAARAQLRIGLCYERLGMSEARKAYEAVLQKFGDQPDFVAQARTRLAAMGGQVAANAAPAGPSAKLLWKKPGWDTARLSPDGRFVAFVNDDDDQLGVRDLTTGANRVLIDNSKDPKTSLTSNIRWSPDGNRIAFSWLGKDTIEIRVVDVKTGSVATYDAFQKLKGWDALDWSPDGKRVLFSVREQEYTDSDRLELAWLSLADGAVKRLGAGECWRTAVVSPDGSRIAFTRRTKEGRTNNDIFITRADGSSTSLLLGGPASDLPLAWTPDGSGLVIRSERTDGVGLWLLSVDGDTLKGPPQLLRGNMANVELFGLSRAGSLLYQTGARQVSFNLATVDFESGRVQGIEPLEAPAGATGISPLSWSPDGHRLAYLAFVEGRRALALKGDKRMRDQVYYFDFNPEIVEGATWSPDGRSLIIGGTTRRGRMIDLMSMYRIDLGSGAAEPLFPPVLGLDKEKDVNTWITAASPDGRYVYMQKGKMSSPGFALWRRDLSEDKETELYRPGAPSGMNAGGPSPDGKWLPFMLSPVGSDERQIMVLPTAGGSPVRLATRTGGWGASFVWAPDSKWLIWAQSRPEGTEVWAVPVAGGEARKLGVNAHTYGIAVHPDGKRIAYADTQVSNEEVWLLENFLPKAAKR